MDDVMILPPGDPDIPADAVYLSGPSRWRNPFRVTSHHPDEGQRVLEQYVAWTAMEPELLRDAHTLLGQTVVSPDSSQPDHAPILQTLAHLSILARLRERARLAEDDELPALRERYWWHQEQARESEWYRALVGAKFDSP